MASCSVCLKGIKANSVKLQCCDCKKDFHGSCLKMSKADVECITGEGIVWRCEPCAVTRRKSLRFDSEVQEGKLSLEDIMKKIIEISENQKIQEQNFNKSNELLSEKIDENTKHVKEQNVSFEKCLKVIDNLLTENKQLTKKVLDLEKRVEEMEQYSRLNAVEIHGIPIQPSEDVIGVVKEVGKALDMEVTDTMIDACHRLGNKLRPDNSPPGIIVKFVRRLDKEEFLRKRRIKRDLSTRHMKMTMDQTVYINEALTPERRRLLAAARQVKRDRNFRHLWVRGGKIFMQKEDGSTVIQEVFDAISRWVQEDPDSRREHVAQLLHCVRFGLVSLEYYSDYIKNFLYNTEESQDLLRTIDALFDTNEDAYYYRYCYFRPRIPNEVIFTFGGWSEGSPTDVIETYDKRSDSWYLSSIKDQKIRAYHGVVVLDTMIYVIGGFDGSEYFSTMHCYDPTTYTWTEKACMHDVRCYVSISTLGGEIYAIGGYNGRTRLNTAEKYNPVTNQWTMIASLNKMRSDASAATLHNKIYVAGGFNGQEVMRSVEVYSPECNRWDFVDCMTTPRSGVSLVAHDRYIYALGGFDGIVRLYSGERYNPIYNRWDQIADMLCPRSNLASVIVDNAIFVIGGFNGSTTVAFTEFYDEEENKWYESARMNINRSALSACVVRGLPNAKSYTFLGVAVDPTTDGAGLNGD